MEIRMFGTLEVRDGGRRIGPGDLGGVKPRQVLELLLLARGHLVCTDMIADALWPEEAQPRNVVATLNTYVCVLRHHMFLDQAQARRVLVTGSGAYRLSLDEVSVDRERFDDLVKCAERAPRPERVRLLSAAVELATGEILENSRYEEWVQETRLLYTDRTTRAHLTLARDLILEGEPTCALRHAERAASLAPYSEEACRLILLSNYALGHHDIVRRVLGQCRTLLRKDLGVDPSRETEQTARAIEARLPISEILAGNGQPTTAGPPRPLERSVA
jgi:DNA-binding SARP family transcriptional activator